VATEAGDASNFARVVSRDTPDPFEANNSNGEIPLITAIVAGSADLEMVKTGPAQVQVGEQFTYTLTVVNHGPNDAFGVQVQDGIDSKLDLVSATSTLGDCGAVATLVLCDAGTVPANTSFTVEIVVVATEAGDASNFARVVSRDTPDPFEANNSNGEIPLITAIVACPEKKAFKDGQKAEKKAFNDGQKAEKKAFHSESHTKQEKTAFENGQKAARKAFKEQQKQEKGAFERDCG